MDLPRPLQSRLRHALVTRLGPRRRLALLQSLALGARVLDVGCGNSSRRAAKIPRPDLAYHGLGIADYNQRDRSTRYAGTYAWVAPDQFVQGGGAPLDGQMDAVISSTDRTLDARTG